MRTRHLRPALVLALLPCLAGAQGTAEPPSLLPAPAVERLANNLRAAERTRPHVWRDTPPVDGNGLVAAYVEIPRGERTKWEFDIAIHARTVDRMIQESIGGYPVNYGFVPQTISYDGDPFDALVLGPPLEGGALVRGVVVGLLHMEDDKGLDSKVVLSPAGTDGPRQELTADRRREIGDFFARYKREDPEAFSRVLGWGSAEAGLAYVQMTHTFYLSCRQNPPAACRIAR